jgi:amidophosphoribosyltransferase
MCGIVAFINNNLNQTEARKKVLKLIKSVQHRGQDSYGYSDGFSVEKNMGMVNSVPSQKINADKIIIGHTRYRTSGSIDIDVCQPIQLDDITLVHNGNINNLKYTERETDSYALAKYIKNHMQDNIINTIKDVINNIEGSFFVIMIYKNTLYCFKDKHGIRPGMYGIDDKGNILISSENHDFEEIKNDVLGGEIIEFKNNNTVNKYYGFKSNLMPCIFEYIYFAHPYSTIYGLNVNDFRLKMTQTALKLITQSVDAVCGVPNSSRVYGLEMSRLLKKDYFEPLVQKKRSFIMPTQEEREKYVREKFQFPDYVFKFEHVLIIDDSIVRGTTSKELIKRFKDRGCTVSFLSCSPLIINTNKFGINITRKEELISYNRSLEDIRKELNCDNLYYQTIENLYKCSGFNDLELSIFEA